MKIYPVLTESGSRTSAFEIENAYVGVGAIWKLLGGVDGVANIRQPSSSAKRDDVRLEFDFRESPFVVWEPFGDNSRFWIGPKDGAVSPVDVSALEEAFSRHRPPSPARLLSDIVTLRWLKGFK